MNKKNETTRLRIGIVGCGRISAKHFEAIRQNDTEIELVAICETNADKREVMERQNGVPGYDCLQSMINEKSLDIVALCTPS